MHCTENLGAADFDCLFAVARDAILATPNPGPGAPRSTPRCDAPGASFVTLTRHGALRGCIGSLEAHRPLIEDVAANARAAAFRDPRFAPLTAREIATTSAAIAVLGAPQLLTFVDEEDFYTRLMPGEDGLIVAYRGRRATFLPSVWEQLPAPRDFVLALRRKAGIADDVPLTALGVQRYATRRAPARPLA